MSFDTHVGAEEAEGRAGRGLWCVLYAAWVNNLTSCLKVPPAWVIFMLCMPPPRLSLSLSLCVCECAQLFVNFACETKAPLPLQGNSASGNPPPSTHTHGTCTSPGELRESDREREERDGEEEAGLLWIENWIGFWIWIRIRMKYPHSLLAYSPELCNT